MPDTKEEKTFEDKPGFLQGTDGDLPAVLSGVNDKTPDTKETTTEEKKDETEKEETTTTTDGAKKDEKEEGKTEEEKKEDKTEEDKVYNATEILAKKPEERTEEEKKALEEGKDALTDEQRKQIETEAASSKNTKKEETKLILGKYKSQEEFEKAHLELQRTLTKLTTDRESIVKKDKEMEVFLKNPIINPQIPDPKFYKLSDGNFDVQGYVRDALKNFAIATQQSFIKGAMGSVMFGMMKNAWTSEMDSQKTEADRDKFASDTWGKITKTYPIFLKKTELQEIFSEAVVGMKTRKYNEAKAKKEEYVEPGLEDYLALAKKIVTGQVVTTKTEEEKTETMKKDSTMRTETDKTDYGADTVENNIKGMQNIVKSRSQSLF